MTTARKYLDVMPERQSDRYYDHLDMAKMESLVPAKYGYRKIRFEKHKFVMIYRIEDTQVIADGMFCELQDYEGIFAGELHLGESNEEK